MNEFLINVIISFVYCAGFIGSIYYLYTYEINKIIILDFLLVFIIHLFLLDTTILIFYKELIFLVLGGLIIFIHHREKIESTLLFSFVIFFQLIFSYPISSIMYASNEFLLESISAEFSSQLGIVAIVIANILFGVIYFQGSYLLKNTIDIKKERMHTVYFHYSNFICATSLIVLFLQDYVTNKMIIDLPIGKQYAVIFYCLIGLALLPFLSLYLLKRIYIQDLKNELLEEELLKINNTRMLAYRYTHNINSMLLTINILAKKEDKKAIINYLDNLKV